MSYLESDLLAINQLLGKYPDLPELPEQFDDVQFVIESILSFLVQLLER